MRVGAVCCWSAVIMIYVFRSRIQYSDMLFEL